MVLFLTERSRWDCIVLLNRTESKAYSLKNKINSTGRNKKIFDSLTKHILKTNKTTQVLKIHVTSLTSTSVVE